MDFSVFSDEHYMKLAYQQAQKAREMGEIPVGAIIVCGQTIVAKAHNQTETLNDVTAHAEMLAITAAANYLGAKYLTECTLFVTLEPCPMCAGAMYWSQLQRLVYGASDTARGYSKSPDIYRGGEPARPAGGHTGSNRVEADAQGPAFGDRHTEGSKGKGVEYTGGYSLLHPRTEVVSGLLAEPCARIVEDFFRELRN